MVSAKPNRSCRSSAGSCYQRCYDAAKQVLRETGSQQRAKRAARQAMVGYLLEYAMNPKVAETSAVLGWLHAVDDNKGQPRRWSR